MTRCYVTGNTRLVSLLLKPTQVFELAAHRMQAAALLCKYVASQPDPNEPVVQLASPQDLKQHFASAGIPLELPTGQQSTDKEALLAALKLALKYSVRTGHPLFFNQLYARADPVSIAGDWLAVAANTNVHTFEVAPVFTAVEVEVLAKLASCVGGAFAQHHDGLFCPGGSISNMYGMWSSAPCLSIQRQAQH